MFRHVNRSVASYKYRHSFRRKSGSTRPDVGWIQYYVRHRNHHSRFHPSSTISSLPHAILASFQENDEDVPQNVNHLRFRESDNQFKVATNGISSATSLWAMDPLLQHLLETVIDYGIPSIFLAGLIGVASFSMRSESRGNPLSVKNNPAAELYEDLYEASDQEDRDPLLPAFFREESKSLPVNAGVPKDEYLTITHYNRKLQSYEYSMLAATQSKAKAASWYRKASLQSALERSVLAQNTQEWNMVTVQTLEQAESEFLKEYKTLLSELVSLQTQFTATAIDEAFKSRGLKQPYGLYNASEVDRASVSEKGEKKNDSAALDSEDITASKSSQSQTASGPSTHEGNKKAPSTAIQDAKRSIEGLEMELATTSSTFLAEVVDIVGAEPVGVMFQKQLHEEIAKLNFPKGLHTMLVSKGLKARLLKLYKEQELSAPSPEVLAKVSQAEDAFLEQTQKLVGEGQKLATQATKAWTQNFFQKVLPPSLYQMLYPLSPPSASASSRSDLKSEGEKPVFKVSLNPSEVIQMKRKLQTITSNMQLLEARFIKQVIQAVEPDQATAIRSTLLGDIAARGSGGLWTALQERPLVSLLQQQDEGASRPRLFVTTFQGDSSASQVTSFREKVTAILRAAEPGDEAFVKLSSPGGTVTGYGSAAGQLMRFKESGIKLTIAVEEVAASGGYMMCCVADHIIASPFAALGSIGVVQEMPNAYERLKREGVEFLTTTAGKYKRTLSPFKKIDPEDIAKEQEQLEDILSMFRGFISKNRPELDLDQVATGEVWYGEAALERQLCDEISTVDDALLKHIKEGYDVYEVDYRQPRRRRLQRLLAELDADERDPSVASWGRRAIRWFVKTIAQEVNAVAGPALSERTRPLHPTVMTKDDRFDRVRTHF